MDACQRTNFMIENARGAAAQAESVSVATKTFLKIALVAMAMLFVTHTRTEAAEYGVLVSKPPGLIKYIEPQYPVSFARRGARGRGVFLITINPKTGDVDQVKIVKSTGFRALNELAVRAFFDWKFRTGSPAQAKVSCEFYLTGFSRSLH